MAKPYQTMDLKEVFFAAKARGIDLPQHMRDLLRTNNHPTNIETARQHLISQLNAVDARRLAKHTYIIAIIALVLLLALLAFTIYAYLYPRSAHSTTVSVLGLLVSRVV
jgi:hypothetical protein